MPELAVQIDGQYVPLSQCDWVWREPCGCPFGVMSAVTHFGTVLAGDEPEAWKSFYDGFSEEEFAARARGVTTELMTHERYGREVMPLMRGGFTHVCSLGAVDRSAELPGQLDMLEGSRG